MIIPVFIPHAGCRNMCIFCNQHAITNSSKPDLSFEKIAQTITTYLSCPSKKKGIVEVAFYGGSFLGLSLEKIEELFKFMAGYIDSGQIYGIRFSTRPDDIDSKRLDIIKSRLVSTVEIGVQSMNDRVLALSARGHTAQDVKNASVLLKKCQVQTGMQMMVGLPGDDETTVMETAQKIVDMSPDFIRIYPVVVLENTGLANLYRKGEYQPFSLDESVRIIAKIYLLFEKHNIPIVRMGLLAHKDLEPGAMIVAGPYHPAFGHLVYSKVFLDLTISEINKMKIKKDRLEIRVHPKNISRVRGHKNKNIEIIKDMWNFHAIDVKEDNTLSETDVFVQCADKGTGQCRLKEHRKSFS